MKPKIIGLTGGIGSGKTTIANYFISLGIPVYISDDQAKKISEQPEIINRITAVFGTSILENNKIDRKKLGSVVFNDANQLQKLNKIIHPAVKKHFENWVLEHKNHKILIKEAAILFESGAYKLCDSVISVVAPLETRILRVINRDKISRDEALSRIKNQWTDEQRILKSDFVIQNDSLQEAKKQVNEILVLLTN